MSDTITLLPKMKYINSHLFEAIRHLSIAANDAHNTLVIDKALKELDLR